MTHRYNTLYKTSIALLLIVLLQVSCKKYLDKKPLPNLFVATTLNDLQALLDNRNVMNLSLQLSELVSDNYYATSADYSSNSIDIRRNYIWDKDAFYPTDWNTPYRSIYYANDVLEQLPKIKIQEQDKELYNDIKGSALFYRAFQFQQLAQVYCKPYSPSANTDLGIPLRLTASITEPSARSTVQQTYDQIINDLKEAAGLLPKTTSYPTRPTKAAAYGALARTYLSMRDYINAGHYADLSLQEYHELIDYNTLLPFSAPMKMFNKEVVYHSYAFNANILYPTYAKIDTSLYHSYNVNDLRKSIFFYTSNGSHYFQGGYEGTYGGYIFNGLVTDEIYLIRAECHARAGNKDLAMSDLNTLMQNRWSSTNWSPFTATDAAEALNKILTERRKELVYRGLRWSDIRRLNLESANITLTRIVNNETFTLPPNDLRTVMLIPPDVIKYAKIEQNPR